MKQRITRLLLIAGAPALFLTCSIAVDYDPERDDTAMARIEQLFSAGGAEGLELILCEDRLRADSASEHSCGVEHIVKGGGRGSEDGALRGGNDCSGCPDQAIAYVQGVVEGGPFDRQAGVQGVILFKDYNDPYRLPYHVELDCIDEARPCRLVGQLDTEGLSLDVVLEGELQAEGTLLHAEGPTECATD